MDTYIVAIDHGTTSTKALLVDHNQQVLDFVSQETRLFYPRAGWVEQDGMELWKAARNAFFSLLEQNQLRPGQIEAIGLSNQRETTLLWDRTTGKPVYPAIVWQSRQSEAICSKWKEAGYEKLIKEKTGLEIDPYFSASKIIWILENVKEARECLEKGTLLFGTMDSWLLWNMSAGKVHYTDTTNASRTMLCNIRTGKWDPELCELLGIPMEILPEIVPSSMIYAYTDPKSFLNLSLPIASMIGDQQSALFGQLCLDEGMAKNTYGTGGFVLMNTGNRPVFSSQGLLTTIAWNLNGKLTYALEGSIFVSGSLLQWLRDSLHLFKNVSLSEDMATSVENSQGVYIVPAFVGLGTPHWDEKARGTILGLSFSTSANHLVRAALESMAFQVADVVSLMEKESGLKLDSLKVDGGACVNNFLLQFQSDLLQKEVIRYKISELTGLGAAFLAGLAAGFWKLDELHVEPSACFVPQKSRQWAENEMENWERALEACRKFKTNL